MFTPHTELQLSAFKAAIVSGGSPRYSYGREQELAKHIAMLEAEFAGKSQLELFHAATIVFIRRGLNLEHCLANFRRMWAEEGDFLRTRLDSRWLISACDTIADHFHEKDEVAIALAGTLFINTIKLYETERLTQNTVHTYHDVFRSSPRVALFDGMSAFAVGGGDMIKNLLHRVSTLADSPVASGILKELIARVHREDTVFSRLRSMHTNPSTLW